MLELTFLALLAATAVAVLIWGQAPERLGLAVLTAGVIATALVGYDPSYRNGMMRWGVFIVDTAVLGLLVGLAMWANRIWTLWFSALQAVTVMAHLINWSSGGIHPWAYAASIQVTGMLMPPCLAFGAYCVRQRNKRGEAWPAWSNISRPSAATRAP